MRVTKFLISGSSCLLAAAALSQSSAQRITPNFRDADITQVIDAVAAATGKNIIVDSRVRAQVTMLSTTPMTVDQFYQAFQSILAVHNFVAITNGNTIKIVGYENSRQYPSIDLPSRISPTSDDIVTQIVAVKSVSAAQLVPTLRVLMPQNANLGVITGSNMLLITDRANNVARIMKIIERIDKEGSSDIDLVPLQNATATDAVRSVTALISTTGADATGNLKVVADERSNSVLISGDASARARVKSLITQLDTPLDAGSETQVRQLEFATAATLATKLKEQMTSSTTGTTTANANAGRVGGAGANAAAAAQQVAQANAGATTLSLQGGTAVIWADEDTNSLIMTAPPRTMRALNAVIDKLDVRRAQVLVEAIIAEVTAKNVAELGVNWAVDGSGVNIGAGGFLAPVGSSSATAPLVDLYNLSKGTATSLPSGTVFGVGRLAATGVNFAMVLKALQTDSRNNIIATPQITTRDNQEAKLSASREVPFVTGTYTGTTGSTSAFQTIQRQQVGTILSVTPQINKGDAVLLKIDMESSELEKTLTTGASDLVTQKRTLATTVQVRDDDWLVLGGLISEGSDATESRVPFLGRIPLLGELFRTRGKSNEKRNLMIFIHPKILRDDVVAAKATDAKYEEIREQQKTLNRETTVLPLISKKGAKVLPARGASNAPATTATPNTPTVPNSTPAPDSGGTTP